MCHAPENKKALDCGMHALFYISSHSTYLHSLQDEERILLEHLPLLTYRAITASKESRFNWTQYTRYLPGRDAVAIKDKMRNLATQHHKKYPAMADVIDL